METPKEILFQATPKQEEFLAAVFSKQFKYLLYGGGIRGGKSYAVLSALLLLSTKYPGSRWIVIRDTLQNLKLTTIPSFLKLCPESYIEKFNQETQTVTFTNGSQLLFFGENFADDKDLLRFRGLECSGMVLEECNELSPDTFYKSIERCGTFVPRSGEKPPPIIMATCNPSPGWVKELFYDRWLNGSLPHDWYYLPALIRDNPYMSAEYLESLKSLTKYQYSVMVEGDWNITLKTGGEIYKSFELEKHVGSCKYNPKLPLHISFDENINPYLPVLIGQVTDNGNGNEVRIIDEITARHPGNSVESVCKLFSERYADHKAGLFIYGDSTSQKRSTLLETGHNFFTMIQGYLQPFRPNMRILKSNPSVAMRVSWLNAVLEKEVGEIKILIDEKCKSTINDFVLTKEAPDGTKNKEMVTDSKTKIRYQANGHLTDAFEYFMVSAFANQYKQYQQGGRTPFPMQMGRRPPSRNSY